MGANDTRWFNMMMWLAECGGDYDLAERSAYFAEIRYPACRRFTDGSKPPGQRKGATFIENKSLKRMTETYCKLQFLKATIEDQQELILCNMNEILKTGEFVGRQGWYTFLSRQ